MPNFKDHFVLSSLATAGTYLAMCRYYNREPELGEFLVCEAVGVAAGAAPDVLEPAKHPNHRGLGHSVAAGTALAKLALANCCQENGDWREFLKIIVAVATISYIVHLVADAFTPKSLPLLRC